MPEPDAATAARKLYLDLVTRSVCGFIERDEDSIPLGPLRQFDFESRMQGLSWPQRALSMVGLLRAQNVVTCMESAIAARVPGDIIETGVWRGGTTILMRAVLKAYGVTDRIVWVADSFQGLPPPNPTEFPADTSDIHHTIDYLRVPLDEVRANFAAYGLLDDQVRFAEGWFRDTLATLPVERFAVIRLDGDMYESTWTALEHLYPKLSPGGYAIIDDYGAIENCRRAVEDYRTQHAIDQPLQTIDWTGVFWKK